MPPPAILHAGRGRGRRRRKQKVEIIQPATIGEDIPVSTSDGIDLAEGLSLFSGDSLFGSAAGMLSMGDGAGARSPSKDGGGKATKTTHLRSDASMMSELTDLSDAASKMSIGQ